MKTRGIVLSDDETRAVLDGGKVQIRRTVDGVGALDTFLCWDYGRAVFRLAELSAANGFPVLIMSLCPYGAVGDYKWVREVRFSVEITDLWIEESPWVWVIEVQKLKIEEILNDGQEEQNSMDG